MSLEFSDFTHYYKTSGLAEAQQRDHFDAYAAILESLVRFFWDEESKENQREIGFDMIATTPTEEVDSKTTMQCHFRCAACLKATRKKES